MSRPIKQGLDYFPLDIDCFQDDKLACLAVDHGAIAELVVIKLLMAVYRNGYYLEWNRRALYALTKSIPGIRPDDVEAIVKSLLEARFFDPEMFEKHSVLTSRGIQRRFFEATRKRRRRDDLSFLLPEFRVNEEKHGVSAPETPANGLESTQSKVKESKAKEKKESQQEKSFSHRDIFSERVMDLKEFSQEFFNSANEEQLQRLVKMLSLSGTDELRRLARDCLTQWELTRRRPDTFENLANHLINHIRTKKLKENGNLHTCSKPATGNGSFGNPSARKYSGFGLIEAGDNPWDRV